MSGLRGCTITSAAKSIEDSMIVCLAGAQAELELLHRVSNACNRDDAEFDMLLMADPRPNQTAKKVFSRVEKLVHQWRDSIALVALALQRDGKLTERQFDALINEHYEIEQAMAAQSRATNHRSPK